MHGGNEASGGETKRFLPWLLLWPLFALPAKDPKLGPKPTDKFRAEEKKKQNRAAARLAEGSHSA